MRVDRAADIDHGEYAQFLDSLAQWPGTALAYHYPFYLRFLRDVAYPSSRLRFITARNDAGALVGVVPALHVETARMNVWLSLAYFGPNAGALVAGGESADAAAVVRTLIREAQQDARAAGCGSMTVYTPLGAAPEPYRDALDRADFEVSRVTQCVPLPDAGGASPWPKKMRYSVRRAASFGIVARPMAGESELEQVWMLYRERCVQQAIPIKPLEHLQALYRTAHDRGAFLVAEREGALVGGLICFVGAGVMSYYLPVAREDARPLGVVPLLIDAAATVARAAGAKLFNFEASPQVGDSVYRFKAECGGQPVPYRVLVKLLRPTVLDEYRMLTPAGMTAEAPHAFIVPFEALA